MTSDSMRDNPNLIAVPVIVSFNTRGEVLPLYFKFKQETVKILSCTQINQSIGSLRYKCQYEFNGAARYVELYYNEHSDLVYRHKKIFILKKESIRIPFFMEL